MQRNALRPNIQLDFAQMKRNTSDHDVLFEYESLWNSGSYPVAKFISERAWTADSQLKLALIRLEAKLKLQTGQIPIASAYRANFPDLEEKVGGAVTDEIIEFANSQRPIEGVVSSLPHMVGGYRVTKYTGRDPISVHYDAIQTLLTRKVRLRAILFPTDSIFSKARIVAKLEHPNSENYVDFFRDGDVKVIVNQLETGDGLADLIAQKHEYMSLEQSVGWVRSLATGLLEMHRCGIVHQNISAANIMIRYGGDAVLLNPLFENPFGCECGCPRLQKALNPFPYRSIDCSLKSSKSAFDTDTVALGLILFQLLTGLTLDSFYLEDPLPAEAARLEKVIDDQLDYLKEVDEKLKSICRRATLGLMKGEHPCHLDELISELSAWERSRIQRSDSGAAVPPKSKQRRSMIGLPWLRM